jgi:hypothetical protein
LVVGLADAWTGFSFYGEKHGWLLGSQSVALSKL